MTIPPHLDHTLVPAAKQGRRGETPRRAARGCLGAPRPGPFAPVYVNDGLTLDFIDTDEAFPIYHFCFRVTRRTSTQFCAHRGCGHPLSQRGARPNRHEGQHRTRGRLVYWNEPDGHYGRC